MRADTPRAWANVDVILQQRHDEIGNLVAAVRDYMTYEQKLLVDVTESRNRLAAAHSTDNGETWQVDKEVVIRQDLLNMDIGYPESMQLADGRILTVYYFNLFGRFFLGLDLAFKHEPRIGPAKRSCRRDF